MPDNLTQPHLPNSTCAKTDPEFTLVKYLAQLEGRLQVLGYERDHASGHKRQLISHQMRRWEGEKREVERKLAVLRVEGIGIGEKFRPVRRNSTTEDEEEEKDGEKTKASV